jgi:hypothetical protein
MNQPSSHPQVPKKPDIDNPVNNPSSVSPEVKEVQEHPSQDIVRQTRSALEHSGAEQSERDDTPVAGESILPRQRQSVERVMVYKATPKDPLRGITPPIPFIKSSASAPTQNPPEEVKEDPTVLLDEKDQAALEEDQKPQETSPNTPAEGTLDQQLEEIRKIIRESRLDDETKLRLAVKVTELSEEKRQLILDLTRERGERIQLEKKRKRDGTIFSGIALLLILTGIGGSTYFSKRQTNASEDGMNGVPLQTANLLSGERSPDSNALQPTTDEQLVSAKNEKGDPQMVEQADTSQKPVAQSKQQDQDEQQSPDDATEWTTMPALPETAIETSFSKSNISSDSLRTGSAMNPEMKRLVERANQGAILNEREIETMRGFRESQINQLKAQLKSLEDEKRNKLDRMISVGRAEMNRTSSLERARLEQKLREEESMMENRFNALRAELEKAIGERRRELDARINTLRNSTDQLFHQSRNAQQSGSF